jgi:mannose-6-phosphate isomerase-like protein (cupin superfamily)
MDLDHETLTNSDFRRSLYIDKHIQLVVMRLKPKEEVGMERHPGVTQFVHVLQGRGISIIGDEYVDIYAGVAFIIPAGVYHNIINTSNKKSLRFYTTYSPPEHNS